MSKMTKIEVFYRAYKKYTLAILFYLYAIFLFGRHQKFVKWTERSDTIILGILGSLDHFRHCYIAHYFANYPPVANTIIMNSGE